MPAYLLILLAFIFPFAIFFLLPLWRHKKTEGSLVLLMFSVFFWGVAIGSTLIYFIAEYLTHPLNFWNCYLLAITFGVFLLMLWLIIKNLFRWR